MDKEKYYGSEIKKEVNSSSTPGNKYGDLVNSLQDDLRKMMDININLSNEINEIEEERQYYLGKILKVVNFCEDIKTKNNLENDTKQYLDNIIQIIKHIPEDFK